MLQKNEVVLFKPKSKLLLIDFGRKLWTKRLHITHNSILSKLRHYVNEEILRTIYFAIFHSYLTYFTRV